DGRPLSFLHVSRPEIDLPPGTDPHSDPVYAQGAQNLAHLVESGVLVRDETPSFYVYRMSLNGHVQTGIACAASVRAYEENRIRKHELTRPDKENDRVRHIDALNAQTGPVLLAYRSTERLRELLAAASSGAPLIDADGPQNVRHSVWQVSDPTAVAELERELDALGQLYIADGHHRSAAAMRIAQARRQHGNADASHEHFLAVAFPHDEMRILDYNRVISDLNDMTAAEFLERLGAEFQVRAAGRPVKPAARRTFGMYLDGTWYGLALKSGALPADPVGRLDVSLLQARVIGPLLGIDDPRTDARISFVGGVRGLEELERLVDSGRAAVA